MSGIFWPAHNREEKRRLIQNASHVDSLSVEELKEVLRYTSHLAELYEMYLLSKGMHYLREADQYIETHKGADYPLL